MSAATGSSTEIVTVHVRLLNEGTDVWRPVEATRFSATTFQLSDDPVPEDEEWSFQPGDVVVAEPRAGSDMTTLIAVARATDFDEAFRRRRKAG